MKSRRRAYTLIEVTVVATVLSMLMLIAASTLYSLYSANRRLRDRAGWQATVAEFSRRLRSDVHQAREVTLRENPQAAASGLEVILDDETQVRYETDAAGVRRSVQRNRTVEHRDLFRLPAKLHTVRWSISADPPRRVVVLVTEQVSDGPGSTKPTSGSGVVIEAVVGLVPAVVRIERAEGPQGAEQPQSSVPGGPSLEVAP